MIQDIRATAGLAEACAPIKSAPIKNLALLNFEWLSRVWVDGGEVEFSGDEEEDCFHGLQASVSARLSFGGLKQSIDSFNEAIGLA